MQKDAESLSHARPCRNRIILHTGASCADVELSPCAAASVAACPKAPTQWSRMAAHVVLFVQLTQLHCDITCSTTVAVLRKSSELNRALKAQPQAASATALGAKISDVGWGEPILEVRVPRRDPKPEAAAAPASTCCRRNLTKQLRTRLANSYQVSRRCLLERRPDVTKRTQLQAPGQ